MRHDLRCLALAAAVLIAALVASPAFAQSSVGRIVTVEGTVRLDAFGKGAFIAARAGDLLYRESVLRVADDGRATLEIGRITQAAPPGAVLRVAELMGAAERKSALRWVDAVGRLVSGVARAVRGSEETVALGSRAADAAKSRDEVSWSVEESEDDERYREARGKLAAGDATGALADLLSIAEDSSEEYSAAELAFWRGHCYFALDDHASALGHLATARRERDADPPSLEPSLARLALLELGASQLYLGRTREAVASLRALVGDGAADERTLYGYLFLVEGLVSLGDRAAAAAALRDAEKLFPRASELAELRTSLSL